MLTEAAIARAKPMARSYQITDGLGLYLLITPAGSKLFRWNYRHGGRQRTMSYGMWPEVRLDRARERHATARKLLATGADPMAARKTERLKAAMSDSNSFATVAGLWLDHWRTGKSAQHVDVTRRRLQANVFPALGSRPITEIEPAELVRMVKAIEARGVGDLAKRSLETCGQIFRYGVAHGHCSTNPASAIKPADVLRPTVKTNLARVGESELPALLRAIEVYQGKVMTRLAVKLMALTFVRTSELIGGKWEEFDFEAKRWNIPKERMKMKAPHIVPLSRQAIEVLELLRVVAPRVEGELVSPYLFPGEQGSATMSNNTILFALRRMGYGPGSKSPMTGHGFRGLASTLLHEQGFDHAHIELQLAHAPRNAVSAAYNHALYLAPRAKMMQHWADYLEGLTRGKHSTRVHCGSGARREAEALERPAPEGGRHLHGHV